MTECTSCLPETRHMSTTRNATTTPQVPRGVDPAAHWRRQVVPSCPFAGTSDRHTHLGCKAESSRRNNLRGNRIGDWLHQPPSERERCVQICCPAASSRCRIPICAPGYRRKLLIAKSETMQGIRSLCPEMRLI